MSGNSQYQYLHNPVIRKQDSETQTVNLDDPSQVLQNARFQVNNSVIEDV